MRTFFHILGWILLVAPFIVLFGVIAKMAGWVPALIILGIVSVLTAIFLFALWLISY